MPIDHGRRLRAPVAIHDVEIQGRDAVLAERAFERNATVHGFGRVISHTFNSSLICRPEFGQR